LDRKNAHYIVYGAKGTGSILAEAALTLLGLDYRLADEVSWDEDGTTEALARVNPMRQLPALILPGGELMTESAAILIWLADDHPEARLAPTMASLARPAFLRWMSFVSAAIYSLYWIRDDPSRVADTEEGQALVKERTRERILECWRIMDAQVTPGRYILGDDLSVLDLYVAVLSRWGPRRKKFYEVAPRMSGVVRRVDADPRLAALWAERFPFVEGWEG
jgi:GST-like protein